MAGRHEDLMLAGPTLTYDDMVPTKGRFTPWTMNLSREQFGLHQAKNVREPIDIEVPKKQYLSPILSIDMVQRLFRWEGQKRWSGKNN